MRPSGTRYGAAIIGSPADAIAPSDAYTDPISAGSVLGSNPFRDCATAPAIATRGAFGVCASARSCGTRCGSSRRPTPLRAKAWITGSDDKTSGMSASAPDHPFSRFRTAPGSRPICETTIFCGGGIGCGPARCAGCAWGSASKPHKATIGRMVDVRVGDPVLQTSGVFQHLAGQIQRIRDLDVDDPAVVVADRLQPWLDEPRVGRHVQAVDARDDFIAERGIEMNAK